jgi:hypothetical protein
MINTEFVKITLYLQNSSTNFSFRFLVMKAEHTFASYNARDFTSKIESV